VTVVNDYLTRTSTCVDCATVRPIELPKSNVLEFVLGDKGSVIARPSGTEPKVKFYFTAVGASQDDAATLLDQMVAQMS
jgi:phosphoglucomutase